MEPIRVTVQGLVPQAKGSKRGFVVRRRGDAGNAEGSKAYRAVLVEGGGSGKKGNSKPADDRRKAWAEALKDAAIEAAPAEPLRGPLSITAVFWMPRPKHETKAQRLRIWNTTKPDGSKLLRAAEDPLTGRVYVDDAQLAVIRAEKRYCPYGEPSRVGCALTISRLESTP